MFKDIISVLVVVERITQIHFVDKVQRYEILQHVVHVVNTVF